MPIVNDLHSNTLHKKKNKNKNSKEYVKIIFGATRGIFGQKKKKKCEWWNEKGPNGDF